MGGTLTPVGWEELSLTQSGTGGPHSHSLSLRVGQEDLTLTHSRSQWNGRASLSLTVGREDFTLTHSARTHWAPGKARARRITQSLEARRGDARMELCNKRAPPASTSA